MSKWISVSERVPKIGSLVLAFKAEREYKFDLLVYSESSEQHRTIIRHDGQWWDDGSRVTHWMPLPAPPTSTEGE